MIETTVPHRRIVDKIGEGRLGKRQAHQALPDGVCI
jgi:hypothetical protein